jgi:hypothetical protein
VRDSSLLAHELLCLHLRSFYGIEPCSTAIKAGAQASQKRLQESSPYSFFAPPEIAFAAMGGYKTKRLTGSRAMRKEICSRAARP